MYLIYIYLFFLLFNRYGSDYSCGDRKIALGKQKGRSQETNMGELYREKAKISHIEEKSLYFGLPLSRERQNLTTKRKQTQKKNSLNFGLPLSEVN